MKIYEYIVRIKDQASDKLKRLSNSSASSMNGLRGLEAGANKASASLGGLGSMAGMAARFLGPAALLAGVLTLGTQMVSLAGDLEQTTVGFEVMLGSAEKAKKLVSDLRNMAKNTPFETDDLVRATDLLLGYGVAAEEILPTLNMLGDASRGNAEKFKLISYAYAQIVSKGKLQGDDLRQLAGAGFNPLKMMSDKTGKSMAELTKQMENGGISADMVKQTFIDATSAGGKFFEMMKKQSQTFKGLSSTLRDEWKTMLTDLGTKLLPTIIEGVKALSSILFDLTNRVDFSPFIKSFSDVYDAISSVGIVFKDLLTSMGINMDQVSVLQYVFNGLAISMRVVFTPLRVLLNGFLLLVDIVKTLVGALEGVGLTLAGVLTRDFTLIAAGAAKTADAFGKGFDDMKKHIVDFGSNEFEAYKQMLTGPKPLNLTGKADEMGPFAPGGLDPTTWGKKKSSGTTEGKVQDGLDKITGGGKQSVNVTINLDSLVGTQNFDVKNIKETVRDMEKDVTEALLRVLNSANYAAAQ